MLSALEASESRFRLLAENAADLITQMSVDGVCRYASPASLEILGYTPEELRGRSILELMHPDELGAGRVRVAEAAKDFWQIRRLTVRYLHKSGRTVHLESTASKVPSGAGDGTWELLAVSRDVTERLEGRVTPGRERGSTEADPGQPAGRLLPGRHRGPAHFRQSLRGADVRLRRRGRDDGSACSHSLCRPRRESTTPRGGAPVGPRHRLGHARTGRGMGRSSGRP